MESEKGVMKYTFYTTSNIEDKLDLKRILEVYKEKKEKWQD